MFVRLSKTVLKKYNYITENKNETKTTTTKIKRKNDLATRRTTIRPLNRLKCQNRWKIRTISFQQWFHAHTLHFRYANYLSLHNIIFSIINKNVARTNKNYNIWDNSTLAYSSIPSSSLTCISWKFWSFFQFLLRKAYSINQIHINLQIEHPDECCLKRLKCLPEMTTKYKRTSFLQQRQQRKIMSKLRPKGNQNEWNFRSIFAFLRGCQIWFTLNAVVNWFTQYAQKRLHVYYLAVCVEFYHRLSSPGFSNHFSQLSVDAFITTQNPYWLREWQILPRHLSCHKMPPEWTIHK